MSKTLLCRFLVLEGQVKIVEKESGADGPLRDTTGGSGEGPSTTGLVLLGASEGVNCVHVGRGHRQSLERLPHPGPQPAWGPCLWPHSRSHRWGGAS